MSVAAPPRPPADRPPRPARAPAAGGPPPAAPVARTTEAWAREAVRFTALGLLLVLSLVRWFQLLHEPPAGRAVAFALAATVVAAALSLVPRRRAAATLAAAVALFAGALLAAGVPAALLDPRDWGQLARGLIDGIGALPGVTVPYRGIDPWVQITIAAGGALLVALAALAAGTGRRGWTLVALGVVFAHPAIQMSADQPWLVGAAFALPLLVLVLVDAVPVRLAGLGAALVVAAVLLAMVVAPRLDGDGPIVDVQDLASAFEPPQPDRFDWSHGYGPLDWPRDGRTLLRVRATRPAYWKAEDLDLFDGLRWRSAPAANPLVPIAEGLPAHPQWREEVRVTVRGLSTSQFVAPGETLSISRSPRRPVGTRPGGFSVAAGASELDQGDAYLAESYVARPKPDELRAATGITPGFLGDELSMLAPPDGSMGRTLIRFAPFGTGALAYSAGPGVGPDEAVAILRRTGYGPTYDLAQRLAAGASSQYEVVQRVVRHLSSSRFVYQEEVPSHRLAVPAFLFEDRAGYCQHFSGAMALLLRMAGVPARVSAGFAPGQFDAKRREYLVRDLDAHSWVEVWFAGIGWVTFDPTPAQAPARSESTRAGALGPGVIPGGPGLRSIVGRGADLGPGGGSPAPVPSEGGSGVPWLAFVAAACAALAGLVGRGWWRRRRAVARPDPLEAEIAELERALQRTGRPAKTATTLRELERRFRHDPGAAGYVRALAARRYAGASRGPTAGDRRALRAALARGLGVSGRLRALWALPPRRLH